MELPGALLNQSLKINYEIHLKLFIFPERKLSGSNIKKFLVFSWKRFFLHFREWNYRSPKKLFIFQEMELSGCNIKKFSYIFSKNVFLIFQEIGLSGPPKSCPYISGGAILSPSSKKWEKPTPKNISYISEKCNPLAPKTKDFCIFCQTKVFLHFRKWKFQAPKKVFLIFWETELSHISANETFWARKNQKITPITQK